MNAKGAMSINEFLEWSSISRSKFYQEVKEGKLRIRKIGRKSIVTTTDAETWLSNLPDSAF